ncbi:MAG: hypothetical protein KDK70_11960 [Myxococcales bacterium]|nr:hypothetical protein [Myxococcales bacterium]
MRFNRLVHAALGGDSLMLAGCVDRSYDFNDSGSEPEPDTSGGTETDPSGGTNPDPTTEPPPPPPPPDVPGPPQLLSVQFVDNLTLALTFTEAVAPPTTVDPAQFRLAAAFAPQGEYYAYGTNYLDPAIWNGVDYTCEEYCYEYCYQDECFERCWEYCYTPPGPPVHVAAVAQLPDQPDVLLLSLDNGISGGVCNQLDGFPDPWIADLFITYTPQGAAPVTDNVGEPLGPIAEHWALQPGLEYEYVEGFFQFMSPMLPIPCPF